MNIIKFEKQPSYGTRKNSVVDVECLYEFAHLQNGQPCVVLKTFNPDSQNKGISQTLHITRETAIQLLKIFHDGLGV